MAETQTPSTAAMKHVVQFSGGLSSYEAAKRVAAQYGTDSLTLLFTDPLVEDYDLYRFLIQAAADVFGLTSAGTDSLAAEALNLPPDREDTIEARKAALAKMRAEASTLIPQLVWLCEGRTPWEVFYEERFMGNSRVDPCSMILKRQMADRWRMKNCDPESTVVYLGFNYDEQGRIERLTKRLAPWRVAFPMDGLPLMNRQALMLACRGRGIEVPRLYLLGFKHNNCGGACCKAGQASFAKTYRHLPEVYARWERGEELFRTTVKIDESILTDRRGGNGKKRLTLQQFRERIECGGPVDSLDFGSCSCFDVDEEPETSQEFGSRKLLNFRTNAGPSPTLTTHPTKG